MRDLEIGLCWGTLMQASLSELIETAGRHGFPTLSVRPDIVLDTILDTGAGGISAAALRRLMRDAGVRVQVVDAISAGLPGGRGMGDAQAGGPVGGVVAGSADACLRVAEDLEAPIVNICHYGDWQGGPFLLQEMIDRVGAISHDAAARGLRLVMEFVPDTGIPSIGAAAAIARGVAMANCGILLDPWHLSRSGGTIADVRALSAGTIGALQLDDRTPPPPGTPYVPMTGRDLPGEGTLPLIELVEAALLNNPGLSAEVEVFSEELRALSPDAAAVRVKEAVAKWRVGLTRR